MRHNRDMAETITIQDQRKNQVPQLKVDTDRLYILLDKAGVELSDSLEIRLRFRDSNGPHGTTRQIGPNSYRVVLNVRYEKHTLSENAQYVVNNTLLHEFRHVAQMQGPKSLSSDYNGWSETEARKFGRTIKGQTEFYAVS